MNKNVLQNQRKIMREYQLDALIANSPENIGYTAGVIVPSQLTVRSRHALCITSLSQDPVMIVVNIEETFVKSNSWIDKNRIYSYNEFTQDPIELLASKIDELGLDGKRIGIEFGYLPAKDYITLTKLLPNVQWVSVDALFGLMRQIKLQHEMPLIKDFGRQAEEIVYHAFKQARAGMTEAELANFLVSGFIAAGGEKLTMLAVTSGERSCFLNGTPTDRVLQPGDVVRVDLIGTKKGYYCDVCRTAVVGEPTPEQRAIWAKLVECHDAVIQQIKPGASSNAIYNSYRQQFLDAGLNPLDFVGHGLGLTLHEEPYIGRHSDTKLEAGMALCIEPIHVVPNVVGYQLENEVIVTANGCEVFTANNDYRNLPTIKL